MQKIYTHLLTLATTISLQFCSSELCYCHRKGYNLLQVYCLTAVCRVKTFISFTGYSEYDDYRNHVIWLYSLTILRRSK